VQNLLLDRLVWFLRNVNLSEGLATVVDHYREGIEAVSAAFDDLPAEAMTAPQASAKELTAAGVPEPLARRIATLPDLAAAPDVVMIADRSKKPIPTIVATYFAAREYFRLDRVAADAQKIVASDYFDRLALDRSLDTIGDAERRLTAAMVQTGKSGAEAVQAWSEPRSAEVERIRTAVRQIAGSGLTLSKLSVAASLLGDLAKD